MKPVRNKQRGGNIKTPHKISSSSSDEQLNKHDPVEVYCRLRSRTDYQDATCITLHSASTLVLVPPDVIKHRKAIQYKFSHIFTEHADQKDVFNHIALPLINGMLQGQNGLLFTYGVTGSGKTYTMSGDSENPGITPRCIHVLFNSIAELQTPKFLIKSDRMNGFEMQSDSDALEERQLDSKLRRGKYTTLRRNQENNGTSSFYRNDGARIRDIDENVSYTVFVQYVEIYNNIVYDLLDENANSKSLQSKILREDFNHNVYVNGVSEHEVKSAEDALEFYMSGKKRKRMGQTSINTESSRSHSIFTIRLVIVPPSNAKNTNCLTVSQLSLVDLAGSERCSRTQTTGQRLKEAGSINNSLMALRNCLEILRENQLNGGASRIVPYRESRLTQLFKTFFEGEGKVKMIICVNPSIKDYDETVHVLKFAELSQEVKVLRPDIRAIEFEKILPIAAQPRFASVMVQTDENYNFHRRSSRKLAAAAAAAAESKAISFPRVQTISPETDEIKSLIIYLKRRKQNMTGLSTIRKATNRFRMDLVTVINAKDQYVSEKIKVKELQKKLLEMECQHDVAVVKCREKDGIIEGLQSAIEEKNLKIQQSLLDKVVHKRKMEEKMNQELDTKLRRQRNYLTAAMKDKENRIEMVRDILNDKVPVTTPSKPGKSLNVSVENFMPSLDTEEVSKAQVESDLTNHVPQRSTPVANVRYRRSRSLSEMWLEHRPVQPVPLGTVLQPVMKRRKSVTKLTTLKDVVHPKQNKYVLISQNQDNVGDLETRLYKGDIIPTCSGGAQVIFGDVEKLKQESPTHQQITSSPLQQQQTRRRLHPDPDLIDKYIPLRDRINKIVIPVNKERIKPQVVEYYGVNGVETREGKSPSYFNQKEIEVVMKYLHALTSPQAEVRVKPEEIGIVVPYIRQHYRIRNRLRDNLAGIEVGTTETFQGREKRVMIISTVRAQASLLLHDKKYNIGFVSNPQRFNVAITRAISKLIIVGNPQCLNYDKNWLKMINFCRELNSYRGFYIKPRDDSDRNIILDNLSYLKYDKHQPTNNSNANNNGRNRNNRRR